MPLNGSGRMSAKAFAVIPAVDIVGEQAVRLAKGDFARIQVRAGNPRSLVERFAHARPAFIHVVDLDGARSERLRPNLIKELATIAAPVPIQASGGIRSVEDAASLLEAGAARVVVGTAAFGNGAALRAFAEALGGRLVVALDVRGDKLQVSGWTRSGPIDIEGAVERCREVGAARILCTGIERDGTLAGPDVALLARVLERAVQPVIAAGGVRSLADIERLAHMGLEGAVVGRALLEGAVPVWALRAGQGPLCAP